MDISAILLFFQSKTVINMAVASFFIKGLFLLVLHKIRRQNYLLILSYGCFAFSLGWALFLLRFMTGINIASLPIANLCILSLPIFITLSIFALARHQPTLRFGLTVSSIFAFTFVFLVMTTHDKHLPGIYTSAINGALYLYTALQIIRKTRPTNAVVWSMYGFCLLLATTLFIRAAILCAGWLSPASPIDAIGPNLTAIVLFGNMLCLDALILCFPLLDFMDTQSRLSQANKEIIERSKIDVLTGAYNRSHMQSRLHHHVSRHNSSDEPFSLILFDLDHFKTINDTYGHVIGDRVLAQAGSQVKSSLRHNDELFRFGGEEFLVILPDTDANQAVDIAERLRRDIADLLFDGPNLAEQFRITSSFGIASMTKAIRSADILLQQADAALYKAKAQGRDRVCV
ncbi:GGDEF domain-containing protein [Solidesulfovibrio carbinolicus]|uniref:diguanylate cyclase n=1 Tax=Solidesulfovibrio carbinolicus TaxID=296842 RepID=A0A4P6HJB9_9BACT|nr:GGDEF domain-containing protein [Solidesulfovibrio carbinolicus]QAZ67187.1 GGDEF domain-containing protein [Solidesulfovibrio carbinolicus]